MANDLLFEVRSSVEVFSLSVFFTHAVFYFLAKGLVSSLPCPTKPTTKNGCPTVMVGAAVGVAGVSLFLQLFVVGYQIFTAAPFPDLLGWMAGKTPVNLIGWQGRMHHTYGEPAMLQRILSRCRE